MARDEMVCSAGAGEAAPSTASFRLGALLQGAIALGILAACLFLPRAGSAVLLVPVGFHPTAWREIDLRADGLTLLGPGQWPGSLLVRSAGPVSLHIWLGRGLLPIAVPAAFCGQRP